MWTSVGRDVQENLRELILNGENDRLEFKLKVPEADDKFLKTVAAFANGTGGTILIGVRDDTSIEGVNLEVERYGGLNRFKDSITDTICNRLVPVPSFNIKHEEIDGRQVVVVTIEEGKSKPYGLNSNPPVFFVRRSGTTRPARQEDELHP